MDEQYFFVALHTAGSDNNNFQDSLITREQVTAECNQHHIPVVLVWIKETFTEAKLQYYSKRK